MGLLRFLLAISVVIVHSSEAYGFRLVDSAIAVQSFYMISGFYMTLILKEKYIGANDSYKLFISNRFLRLFPIYWTVLILAVSYSIIQFLNTKGDGGTISLYVEYFNTMSWGSFFFLIFTNVLLFFQDMVMFMGLNTSTGHFFYTSNFQETTPQLWTFLFIPQAWTIGVEITFYMLAPFLLRRKMKLILGVIALSLLLRAILYFYFDLKFTPWTNRFFPTELAFFLLGTTAYHIYKWVQTQKINNRYLFVLWVAMIGASLIYNLLPFAHRGVIYLLLVFSTMPFVFKLTQKSKIDNYIGNLSYPIYISYSLAIPLEAMLNIPTLGTLNIGVITMTIFLAVVLHEVVARRIEKIRQGRLKLSR